MSQSFTRIVGTPRRVVRQLWRDLLSVYYANTPVWRWLKSGTLVLFGLACWTGASLLLSYRPDWPLLTYVSAYGFALILWGPLTHFGIVPLAIRLRRTASHPLLRTFARHASKINLTVFLVLVILLGAYTPGVVLFEFSGALSGGDSPDASATIECEVDGDRVSCVASNVIGADHVVVTSGADELVKLDDPPYTFELDREALADETTGKVFTVELRDADGDTLRRYVQTV